MKLIIGKALARADGRAERHKVNGDIRAHRMVIIEVQRLFEAMPQPFHEIERTAQKQDVALDAVSLRQRGNGLIDHCLKDARAQIGLIGALVDQRLDIRLGEHAAA